VNNDTSCRPKPFVCAACGLAYETEIALRIWCTRLHERETRRTVTDQPVSETRNDHLPWKLTAEEWEIFKLDPESFRGKQTQLDQDTDFEIITRDASGQTHSWADTVAWALKKSKAARP
jgi:hypothetical protein